MKKLVWLAVLLGVILCAAPILAEDYVYPDIPVNITLTEEMELRLVEIYWPGPTDPTEYYTSDVRDTAGFNFGTINLNDYFTDVVVGGSLEGSTTEIVYPSARATTPDTGSNLWTAHPRCAGDIGTYYVGGNHTNGIEGSVSGAGADWNVTVQVKGPGGTPGPLSNGTDWLPFIRATDTTDGGVGWPGFALRVDYPVASDHLPADPNRTPRYAGITGNASILLGEYSDGSAVPAAPVRTVVDSDWMTSAGGTSTFSFALVMQFTPDAPLRPDPGTYQGYLAFTLTSI